MRVARADRLGRNHSGVYIAETRFGRVLCVSRCWSASDETNRVKFVGVQNSKPERGFLACCFRKIDEIKPCVRAAEKFKQPQEEQPA